MACKHPTGVACHCNRGQPCLVSYQIDSDGGSSVYRGNKPAPSLTLLDKGQGCPISVSVVGLCLKGVPTCPTGYIKEPEGNYIEPLSATECQPFTLKYNDTSARKIGLLSAIKYLLAEDNITHLPYTSYQVGVTQCGGQPQINSACFDYPNVRLLLGSIITDTFIYVYPTVVIEPKLTLSCQKIQRELSEEERYATHQTLQQKGLVNGMAIPAAEIKKQFRLTGSLTITQGSSKTEYSSSVSQTQSNLPDMAQAISLQQTFDDIKAQMSLINGIINIIEQIKNGTYQSNGKDKIKLVKFNFEPPKIELKNKLQTDMQNGVIGSKGEVSVGFDPLCDIAITLDLVMAAATYFKIEKPVAEIIKAAGEIEDKVNNGAAGAYAGVQLEITLKTALRTDGTITFQPDHTPSYHLSTETKVALSGLVNVRGGARVWIVEGAFKFQAEVTAEAKCALKGKINNQNSDKESPELELVFFHDGIKAKVQIDLSASINGEKKSSTAGNSDITGRRSSTKAEKGLKKGKTQEWLWVEPMSEADSTYRTTLLGG